MAVVVIATSETLRFTVVSPDLPNPEDAFHKILIILTHLEAAIGTIPEIIDISITVWHRVLVWKTIAFGSMLGGLLVIGLAYVWDDALTYERRRRQRQTADE